MKGCQHPHDDPLVIKAIAANKTIHRVLVNFQQNGHRKREARTRQHLPTWILWRKGATSKVDTISAHYGKPPMPGNDNSKISQTRCPISLQYVTGKGLSQCHKGHPLRLSHGYQIPNFKWSGNGSRKPARGQGVLLSINETKNDRQHLHGRARHAR